MPGQRRMPARGVFPPHGCRNPQPPSRRRGGRHFRATGPLDLRKLRPVTVRTRANRGGSRIGAAAAGLRDFTSARAESPRLQDPGHQDGQNGGEHHGKFTHGAERLPSRFTICNAEASGWSLPRQAPRHCRHGAGCWDGLRLATAEAAGGQCRPHRAPC